VRPTREVRGSGPGSFHRREREDDADATFLAASLNKLAVLMALYRSAAGGEVDLDDKITMQASDVQAYGTGVLYTRPVGHTLTLRECANLLIKESDNTAWKMLDRYLGRDYIRAELYRVGARSTEYWIPNTTTPNDVQLMLKKISDPSYTTPDLSAEMLEVMTEHLFRGPPAPAPPGGNAGLPQDRLLRDHVQRRWVDLPRRLARHRRRLLYSRDGERHERVYGARRHAGDVPRHLPIHVRHQGQGRRPASAPSRKPTEGHGWPLLYEWSGFVSSTPVAASKKVRL
jgi:hypothetical protein